MDGLAAVTARVQQIQGLVQSMSSVRPGPAVLGAPVASSASVGTTAASGSAGTFEAAMARATEATAPSGTSRAVDADGVPVELARYGNGRIPADALTPIGVGNHRLWGPAAESFVQLRAAAKAAGVTIGVTDSYRSYEAQVDVARRKGLYKDGGLAAVPGTSEHGWGMAVDLDLDSKAQSWMRANAGRFGFSEDVPREPWHWAFTP